VGATAWLHAGPLVIVACGATKLEHPAPAGELYIGSYHRACRSAAVRLTCPSRLRILSARAGLLPLDAVAPYDVRAGSVGAVDAVKLRHQARRQLLLDELEVIVLGGRTYADLVRHVWPHALWPLAGTHGIGEQLARLAAIARSPRPASVVADLVRSHPDALSA